MYRTGNEMLSTSQLIFSSVNHIPPPPSNSAIHKAAGRAVPGFAWYISCETEKCPLAVNGSRRQERPPKVVLYGSRPYCGFVNSAVKDTRQNMDTAQDEQMKFVVTITNCCNVAGTSFTSMSVVFNYTVLL